MNVKPDDKIPVRATWTGEPATAAVARAFVLDTDGTLLYWNGSAFTSTPATLSGMTLSGGVLSGFFTVPAAAAGKILTIQAEATAPTEIAGSMMAAEYVVETSDTTAIKTDTELILTRIGQSGDTAADPTLFGAAESLDAAIAAEGVASASRDGTTQALVEDVDADLVSARAALESLLATLQASVNEMDADAGEPADTGGSSTAGTRAAKLNHIIQLIEAFLADEKDIVLRP